MLNNKNYKKFNNHFKNFYFFKNKRNELIEYGFENVLKNFPNENDLRIIVKFLGREKEYFKFKEEQKFIKRFKNSFSKLKKVDKEFLLNVGFDKFCEIFNRTENWEGNIFEIYKKALEINIEEENCNIKLRKKFLWEYINFSKENRNVFIKIGFKEVCKKYEKFGSLLLVFLENKYGKEFSLRCRCGKEIDFKNKTIVNRAMIYNYDFKNLCLSCFPKQKQYSQMEKDVVKFIRGFYKGEILENIHYKGNSEFDIYLPNKNLVIEFDGTYWHNKFSDKKYFYCLEKGIDFILVQEHRKEEGLQVIKNRILGNEKFGEEIVLENIYYQRLDGYEKVGEIEKSFEITRGYKIWNLGKTVWRKI